MLSKKEILTIYRQDLSAFIPFAFNTLYSHKQFLYNWHIDAIAHQLERCYRGEIKRLIINMPPRYLKSFCASIVFPAWVLGRAPNTNLMCISYGEELVRDFGTDCQRLMQSPRYQQVFPHVRFIKNRFTPNHMQLIHGGSRLGISAGGAITGRGADIIIIDDPIKASEAHSKERSSINQWFDDNIVQRLNNKNNGVIILIMQRLHEDDLTGHLLSKGSNEWTELVLPAIAIEDMEYELSEGGVYVRPEGEVLHPQLESEAHLLQLKKNQGNYVFEAQFQQSPLTPTDSLIKRDWFIEVEPHLWPKTFSHITQSWDIAHKQEQHNDYSVCITFGYRERKLYILNVYRHKLTFPELLNAVKQQKDKYHARTVIAEESTGGICLEQALFSQHIRIKTQKPVGEKFMRLAGVSGMIESGMVHIPEHAPWIDDFIAEIIRFPSSRHDDQVDALSQGLRYFQEEYKFITFYDNI